MTDGVEQALGLAQEAAGDRDVAVAGGGQIVMHCLREGLLDELRLDLVPILLGGLPLFDGAGFDGVDQVVEVIDTPGVTHIRYRPTR